MEVLVEKHKRLAEKKKMSEFKVQEALSSGKEAAAQHLGAEVSHNYS